MPRTPWVAGVAFVLLVFGPSVRAENAASAPSPQLAAFEELRARVADEIAEGRLPAGTATATDELSFELERELIRSHAEIDVLRLEIARFEGEAQRRAVDRLIEVVAAREGRVVEMTRRLEELAGVSPTPVEPVADSEPVAFEESRAFATSGAAGEPAAGNDVEDEGATIEISFEAQDLTEEPDP